MNANDFFRDFNSSLNCVFDGAVRTEGSCVNFEIREAL